MPLIELLQLLPAPIHILGHDSSIWGFSPTKMSRIRDARSPIRFCS